MSTTLSWIGMINANSSAGQSITIATGYNAVTVGPFTVSTGDTITISDGANWYIV